LICPVIDALLISCEIRHEQFALTKTTSSNVREFRISVAGGGGGLMLDLIPVFVVMLMQIVRTLLFRSR
jgi:hypothetical protein